MRRLSFIALFATALIMAVQPSVFAQSIKEQQSKKARLERDIALIDKQLKDISAKSGNALNSLALIRKKVADRKALVEESDREIAGISSKITAKKKEINLMQQQLDTLSAHYTKLLTTAYVNRDAKIWYMHILSSENLGQAFRRLAYMKSISSNLNEQGGRIKEYREELLKETDSLNVMYARAAELRNKRAADLSTLQSEEADAREIVNQMQRNKSKYQKELADMKKQMDAINRQIQSLMASSGSGRTAGGKSAPADMKLAAEFATNKGKLPWPASGPVVRHFGTNYHPVFKNIKLPPNNGVDIALERGSEIKAVFDGIVKKIEVIAGYNICILIQHGNYCSLYCKIGSASVNEGQKVKTGDVLGTVGTLDNSTQLHFEIWQGGRPQNPELWLR